MLNLRKIISWFSVFAMAISVLCVPAFSSDGSFGGDRDSIGGGRYKITDFYNFSGSRDYGGGGRFSSREAYEEFVGTLLATGYNSDGSLILTVPVSYVIARITSRSNDEYGCSHYSGGSTSEYFVFTVDEQSHDFSFTPLSGNGTISTIAGTVYATVYFSWTAPVSGYYSIVSGSISTHRLDNSKSYDSLFEYVQSLRDEANYIYSKGNNIFFDSGDKVLHYISDGGFSGMGFYFASDKPTPVVYRVTPLSSVLPEVNTVYNTTTRPTTITGSNYGIVGDNGQLTVVNGDIINETNNTYYNPATGQGDTITNWSYDYSDRSYNITLESGGTVTVTYGDENITINEGDIVYNIYYIIDGSGSGSDPDPGPSESLDPDPGHSSSPSAPPSGGDDPDNGDDGDSIWDKLGKFFGTILGGIIGLIETVVGKTLDALIALGEMIMDSQPCLTTAAHAFLIGSRLGRKANSRKNFCPGPSEPGQ